MRVRHAGTGVGRVGPPVAERRIGSERPEVGVRQAGYLARACGDDAALRSEIELLLAAGLDTEAADMLSDAHLARARAILDRMIDDVDGTRSPRES